MFGYAQHGKDTVAEMIQDELSLTFESSSLFAAECAVLPYLKRRGITYDSVHEAYADRDNHRAHWKAAIKAYNTPDLTRLTREIFAAYDIYVGCRDRDEFLASRDIYDLVIWVDASKRKPQEATCQITADDCDLIIPNNGTEAELRERVERVSRWIRTQ